MPRTLEGRRIVLGRRDLLLVVLDFLPDPPAFPTLREWYQVLPPWFLQACGPERGRAEEEAWLQR